LNLKYLPRIVFLLLIIRYTTIALYFIVWGIICLPIVLVLKPRSATSAPIVAWLLGKPVINILGLKIKSIDKHKFYPGYPCVFVGNHQSNIDAFAMAYLVPKNTVFLAKKSLLYIPIFGAITWFVGTIFINREKRKHAVGKMDAAAEDIKKNKVSVYIMPEGTRSHGKGLGRFKKGAFHTAKKANVPIIPMAFSSYREYIDLNKWNAGTILVKFMDPISPEGKTVDELMQETREVISKTIKELDLKLSES